jgi:LPS sulfotransferase NodH
MNIISRIKQNPAQALKIFNHRLFSICGHSNFVRFIVLTRSRTGSNLLLSFLNSHPNIFTESEIFNKLSGRNYQDILLKTFTKQPYFIKAKGFKIFYYHPLDDKSNGLWDDLTKMDNLRIIHLKRRNIFRTIISRKIAGQLGSWSTSSPKESRTETKKTIVFTKKELEESFIQTRKWENIADKMFKKFPMISIYYEDLISDPVNTFNNITDFLNVKHVQPKTKLRKQNPEKQKHLVSNYDELMVAFTDTEWHSFFED